VAWNVGDLVPATTNNYKQQQQQQQPHNQKRQLRTARQPRVATLHHDHTQNSSICVGECSGVGSSANLLPTSNVYAHINDTATNWNSASASEP
jgi:hypothetical protein